MSGVTFVRGTMGGALEGAKTKAAGRWPKIVVTVAITLLFARAAQGEEISWEHNVVNEEHAKLLDDWHGHLIESVEEDFRKKVGDVSDVLAPLREYEDLETVPPATWIKPTLKGRGNDKVTLWFCNDNIYFLAFNTTPSKLHTSSGYDALFPEPFLPLRFGPTYRNLMGHTAPDRTKVTNAHLLLVNVPLGRESLLDAIHILSHYDPDTTTDDHEVKLAMAKILIMGPESLRFHTVRDAYIVEWNQVSYLTVDQAKLLVAWGPLSEILLDWEDHGRYGWLNLKGAMKMLDNFGINSAEDALGNVALVLRRN